MTRCKRNSSVYPEEWKKIISKHPYEFCPRMIFNNDNKWLWQASENKAIDISNWKIHWKTSKGELLKTMDEFMSINDDDL